MRAIADTNFEKWDLEECGTRHPLQKQSLHPGSRPGIGHLSLRDHETEFLHYGKNAKENGINTREASLGLFFTGS